MSAPFAVSITSGNTTIHYSDVDSDAAAAIRDRTFAQTRRNHSLISRRDIRLPLPGTRRFRRLLNSLLSGDEGDGGSSEALLSQSDAEAGEPEVWRSEWRGEFLHVGDEFFSQADSQREMLGMRRGKDGGEEDRSGNRVLRRLRKLEGERREKRRERKERLERRQRRLALVEVMGDELPRSATPAAQAQDVTADSLHSIPSLQQQQVMDISDAGEATDEPQQQQQEQAAEDEVFIPGEAISTDLWLLIDKSTRCLLRRMQDFAFLHALEQLLMQFKEHCRGITRRQTMAASSHSASPAAFVPASMPYSRHFQVLPSPIPQEVALVMPEAFLRLLTYGVLAFHFMYSASTGGRRGRQQRGRAAQQQQEVEDDAAGSGGLLVVRMQRGCVYHDCSLQHYIASHFHS